MQLRVWALTRGRATRAMLMGTKWAVSPRWITEGEEKHVFSCIHVETWDPSLFFLSFLLLSYVKQVEAAMSALHALLINALMDLTDFQIDCHSVSGSQI